jgi:hypothetical protein
MGADDDSPFAGVWEIFEDAGLLVTVTFVQPDGAAVCASAEFVVDDELSMDGQLTVSRYELEYRARDLSGLARNSVIEINGLSYKVIRPPRRKDGERLVADLEIVK